MLTQEQQAALGELKRWLASTRTQAERRGIRMGELLVREADKMTPNREKVITTMIEDQNVILSLVEMLEAVVNCEDELPNHHPPPIVV